LSLLSPREFVLKPMLRMFLIANYPKGFVQGHIVFSLKEFYGRIIFGLSWEKSPGVMSPSPNFLLWELTPDSFF
jgi:hypothetical protein